jgi:uncharacterized lipoprotein YmbA
MKALRCFGSCLSLAVAACASPDPTIYTLEPIPGAALSAPAQVIELRRPGLAGYLDRSDVVLKDEGYRLRLNSQARWAEPVGDMIGRVLAEDLGQRLPASIVFSPSGAITADPGVWIEINIQRFGQEPDGRVVLLAEIAVEGGHGHSPLATSTVRLDAMPDQPGARDLVAVMSKLLGQLADRVAKQAVLL